MPLQSKVFRPIQLVVLLQLVALAVVGLFANYSAVQAMPSDRSDGEHSIRGQLEEILAQSEFQPRGNTQNAWERLKQNVVQWATETIAEIWRGIPKDLIKLDPDSGLGYWLLKLAEFAAAILKLFEPLLLIWRELLICAGVLAILYVLFIFVSAQLRHAKPSAHAERIVAARPIRTFAEVQALGPTRAGLLAFREFLRDQLEQKHSIAPSATDREMCRTLPRGELQTELFTQTAALFESAEFAGLPFSGEQLVPLLNQYQQTLGRAVS